MSVVFGSAFAAVGTGGIVAVVAGADYTRSPPLLLVALVPGIFALIGFGLLFAVARSARHRRRGTAMFPVRVLPMVAPRRPAP